ncbi:MAG TPA: division/cell wall cluster transcriptional repressor MraZ [Salinivirgaceae bacterium]|nr:division/cell wall cluster transcriptional repressor MraZ [Salinivirgaceae bacterium]HQA76353.1 division/cell wall cluster transcriptional repressor MraZ [Salinivirgaceae bacterium]
MVTFIGEYNIRIDAKGRIVLPTAFIKQVGDIPQREVFILKEDMYEQCLVLYPISEWDRQNQIIRSKLNPFDREHNQFLRSFSKGAVEVSTDNVNRILIPKRLLEFAKITKEIVLSGQDGKIEVWSAEMYQNLWDNSPDFEQLAKKVMNS